MSTHSSNPYALGTPEYALWARWHRVFFDQPVHGQLLAIGSQLRHNLTELLQLSSSLPPSDAQRAIHAHLMEIEESLNLLEEAAEHAYVRVISRKSSVLHNGENA
jgi:hypothetical protein